MKFKASRDRFFLTFWASMLLFINVISLAPILFFPHNLAGILTVLIIDLSVSALLIWFYADMGYTFQDHYLFVKGGMFRSKILYKDITKVTRNPNIWAGYRLLSSKDAIELHYKTGLLGSVTISPENKETFISELKKRNMNIFIEPAKST